MSRYIQPSLGLASPDYGASLSLDDANRDVKQIHRPQAAVPGLSPGGNGHPRSQISVPFAPQFRTQAWQCMTYTYRSWSLSDRSGSVGPSFACRGGYATGLGPALGGHPRLDLPFQAALSGQFSSSTHTSRCGPETRLTSQGVVPATGLDALRRWSRHYAALPR